jgi:hypothetical protein
VLDQSCDGRPFRVARSPTYRSVFLDHWLGFFVPNFLTCSSTWVRL